MHHRHPLRGAGPGRVIDKRAIVDSAAELGAGVEVGPWSHIGPGVSIGDDCRIGPHTIVKGPTVIGKRNRIFQFASVGEDTPALAYGGEPTTLRIGDDNVIREGVTIHRGMLKDRGATVIGDGNLFMAYVHIGHDCDVGNRVIMANNASLAGHVTVGDGANIGGYAGVLQFRTVGAFAHIAAFSYVIKDVPDFVTAVGNPAKAAGLNVEGMRRRKEPSETIDALRRAYKLVFRSGLTVREASEALADSAGCCPPVAAFIASVRASKHGIVRPRGMAADQE